MRSYSIRVGGAMRNLVNVALISAAKADVSAASSAFSFISVNVRN